MIWFTDHAVKRYIERLRPALDTQHALTELRRLAAAGTQTPTPPRWCAHTQAEQFLRLGDDVCVPLHTTGGRTVAPTVMVRDIAPSERARRTERPRQARQARQHRHRHPDPRPAARPAPTVDEELAAA